jgi:hypothetical protein
MSNSEEPQISKICDVSIVQLTLPPMNTSVVFENVPVSVQIPENNPDSDNNAIIVLPDVNTQDVVVNTFSNNSSKCALLMNSSPDPNYESGAEHNVVNDNVSSTHWMKTLKQNYANYKEVFPSPVHQLKAVMIVRIVSLIYKLK